jgi:hypothetical protein
VPPASCFSDSAPVGPTYSGGIVLLRCPFSILLAAFRPRLAAVALAFSVALHLHQVGQRTCTPKLLSMPSTQLNRLTAAAPFSEEVDPCQEDCWGGALRWSKSETDGRLR